MYKQIILSNPKYGVTGKFSIEKKYYDMHYSMHKIRPEEAFRMIEKVILDEYNMASSLKSIVTEARKKYDFI